MGAEVCRRGGVAAGWSCWRPGLCGRLRCGLCCGRALLGLCAAPCKLRTLVERLPSVRGEGLRPGAGTEVEPPNEARPALGLGLRHAMPSTTTLEPGRGDRAVRGAFVTRTDRTCSASGASHGSTTTASSPFRIIASSCAFRRSTAIAAVIISSSAAARLSRSERSFASWL